MLSRLFGPRIHVTVRVLGQVGERMVRWEGRVALPARADLASVLRAAGKAAGADLSGALAAGAQPAVLLNGQRVELPAGLATPVGEGATVAWLMPMAGG